jgi:hypothetical protein
MDQTQTVISDWFVGKIKADAAEQAIALLTAVRHQIVCEITQEVLDVRTSVYIETEDGPGYVMSASAWDENGETFKAGLVRLGQTLSLVVDGRELHEQGVL